MKTSLIISIVLALTATSVLAAPRQNALKISSRSQQLTKLSVKSSELGEAIAKAIQDVQTAVGKAEAALQSELAGQGELIGQVEGILANAAQKAESILLQAGEELLAAGSVEEALAILENAVNNLKAVAQSAAAQIRAAVANSGVTEAVTQILQTLEADLSAAVQPVLDLILGSGAGTPKLQLVKGNLLELIEQAARDAEAALRKAEADLRSVLEGQNELVGQVEGIVAKAGQDAQDLLEQAEKDLLAAGSAQEALSILKQAASDLEARARSAAADIVAAVSNSDVADAVKQILQTLETELLAAIQPLLDLIGGGGGGGASRY